MDFERGTLTFHRRPLFVVVELDRNLSSRTMNFHTLGRIPVAVVEVEVVSDIVMVVEAVFVPRLDYLVAGYGSRIGLVAVGFLY